jgi:hypothetical protein
VFFAAGVAAAQPALDVHARQRVADQAPSTTHWPSCGSPCSDNQPQAHAQGDHGPAATNPGHL